MKTINFYHLRLSSSMCSCEENKRQKVNSKYILLWFSMKNHKCDAKFEKNCELIMATIFTIKMQRSHTDRQFKLYNLCTKTQYINSSLCGFFINYNWNIPIRIFCVEIVQNPKWNLLRWLPFYLLSAWHSLKNQCVYQKDVSKQQVIRPKKFVLANKISGCDLESNFNFFLVFKWFFFCNFKTNQIK